MPILTEESAVMAKTRELCASILEESEFKAHLAKVERFVEDAESRALFVQLSERGDALHHKQHEGVKPSREELLEFQQMQASAMENETIRDFIEAQNELQAFHSMISGYVAKTLELGRVPEEKDFADEEGGCGQGCGCH